MFNSLNIDCGLRVSLCLFTLKCVCTGIFLGTGKQKIPAVANFIGYYCVGLSLSVTLMFVAKLGVLGIRMN